MTTAAALIIGDEILTGKVKDENTFYLSTVLFEQGVDLIRVETLPDEVEVIVDRLRHYTSRVDYIFTSGGIGPTHDDRTYEAVASAFEVPLELHIPSFEKFCSMYKMKADEVNEVRRKMSKLPSNCSVIEVPDLWVPLAVVNNVYIYPGVPELFRHMLNQSKQHFVGVKSIRKLLYTKESEGAIAESLAVVADKFPNVMIGSYPKYGAPNYKVMVSVEGKVKEEVKTATEAARAAIAGFTLVDEVDNV